MNRKLPVRAALLAIAATLTMAAAPPAAQFPTGPQPPKDAPNVLVIMTDDVGFGAASTFGGAIPTPTFDALAAQGARFSAFHTSAVCAPSRAALLTGRNPHRVGMGAIPEMATPEPGYNGVIPPSAATFARVLQLNGYATAMFGKHHATPVWEDIPGAAGPHMPNNQGFDYFYGFIGAATNPWYPALRENLNRVRPPTGDPNYHLDRDMADHAIDWLRLRRMQTPERPFLIYYAPATLHAPVVAPEDWIARFRGKFDAGWDVLRQEIYQRQKRMGVIPKDAALAPMPEGTPRWDSLSPDQKRLAARHMEVYAAALAFCDDQIGRVIAELKRSGQYDNTLIVYIQGDNGPSVEGGADGAFSYSNRLNGTAEDFARNLARIDQIGGRHSLPATPAGWTRATSAPFPWNKTIASHLGGTRNGMVVSWPGHVARPRDTRYQFTHVVDLAPTLYQAIGVEPPAQVDGAAQSRLDGASFLDALRDPNAPGHRREQYFEVFGNMGLYQDGWLLSSTPLDGGESLFGKGDAPVRWELYDLTRDFSQTRDLAAREPARLAQMVDRFQALAKENQVEPIRRDMISRIVGVERPVLMTRPGLHSLFNGPTSYGASAFPDIRGKSWSAEAAVTVPAAGGDGMIATQGGRFGGWGLMVQGGRLAFVHRFNDLDDSVSRLTSAAPLTPGAHRITLAFAADAEKPGSGGVFTLSVDGRAAGTLRVERTAPRSWYEEAQIGRDYDTPLSADYATPFVYPGTIDSVTFDTR